LPNHLASGVPFRSTTNLFTSHYFKSVPNNSLFPKSDLFVIFDSLKDIFKDMLYQKYGLSCFHNSKAHLRELRVI
jgi:hypothetical protein